MPASEGRARRIIHNTLLLFGSEKAAQLFSLVAFIFLTRYWDVQTYGQYALIKNWVAIFATFSDLGLNSLTIREVARKKGLAGFYLRNVMGIRSVFSIVLVAALAIFGVVLHYEPIVQVGLVLMGCRIIFDCLAGAYVYLLQAHEKMGIQGGVVVLGSIIRLGGLVTVFFLGWGLWGACGVWTLASLVALVVLVLIGRKKGWKLELSRLNWVEIKATLVQALPLAGFWSFQMLYFQVDTVLLKSLSGNESVGFYDAAYTLLRSTLTLSQLFGLSVLPAFSASKNPKDFGKLALKSIRLLIVIGVPISIGGMLLSDRLLTFFSGEKYLPSGDLFRVLVLSVVPFFISNVYINVLTVKNPKMLNIVYFSLFVLNVGINFLFIPQWAAQGAAWATVLCEIVGLAWGLGLIWKYLPAERTLSLVRALVGSLTAAALMGVGIYFSPELYWLILGPVVYGLGLYFFSALEPEDQKSALSVLRLR